MQTRLEGSMATGYTLWYGDEQLGGDDFESPRRAAAHLYGEILEAENDLANLELALEEQRARIQSMRQFAATTMQDRVAAGA